jgi:glycosyltransferase involved in cell wall biosynthesis
VRWPSHLTKEAMRILLIGDSLSTGGAERQMALLATALPPAHERLVCSIDDGPFSAVLRRQGVEVIILGRRGRRDPSPILGLSHAISSFRPDVVHSWGWMSTIAAVVPCRLHGIPLIDGTIRSGRRPMRHSAVYWWTERLADQVVGNSRAGLAAHPVPRRKGRVVHNGLELVRAADGGHRSQMPGEVFRVVMTARMAPEKDFDTFMQAARRVANADGGKRQWIFLAVGDGVSRERLLEENLDLVDAGAVQFQSPGLDVTAFLRGAHVGVLLSDERMTAEGCSNSILEYMAFGLPVVCSRGGGNAEVVVAGRTGFIIPPRDPACLVECLRYLEAHRDEADRMGALGRHRVVRLFSAERFAEEMLKTYRGALSRGRQRLQTTPSGQRLATIPHLG